MEKIDQIKHLPQVGKYYLVPHVKCETSGGKTYFIPVIGPPHVDKELAPCVLKHYHVDLRFSSVFKERYTIKRFPFFEQKTNIVLGFDNNAILHIVSKRKRWLKKKCSSQITGIRLNHSGALERKWHDNFLGKNIF
ncbi:hypothetical protein JYU20_00755 [Bacteroidales bacterium AH-315-I05]|nr:hypothetical protein [Bacteroidales bacterium AH-315-I05]